MRYLSLRFGHWLLSNPPEADYNRNDQSTDVLWSSPAHKGGEIKVTRIAGGR